MLGFLLIVFTFVVPALFFLGILIRVIKKAAAEGGIKTAHAEPIVLLLVGGLFLAANAPYVNQLSTALEFRLQLSTRGGASPEALWWFRLCFGLGIIALLATLAKAFWTHVVLEDNQWGDVKGYRDTLSTRSSWPEYLLRCAIAVLIIFTQKELTEVQDVPLIDEVDLIRDNEESATTFSLAFSSWLQGFCSLAFYIYFFIVVWLAIVFPPIRQNAAAKKAAHATAWSTGPALGVVWIMHYLATGNLIPIPFLETLPAVIEPWKAWSATSVLLVLAMIIMANVFWSLKGPLAETGLIKRKKSEDAPTASDPSQSDG